jgi:hypothetical protein
MFLESDVYFDGLVHPTDTGTPQGGVISPLLANIYLNHLDRQLSEEDIFFVRYADDLVVFCENRSEAEATLWLIRETLGHDLHLELSDEKTKIVYLKREVDENGVVHPDYGPFEFLGFRIGCTWMSPLPSAIERFKNKIRALTIRHQKYETDLWFACLNAVIRGWGNYYRIGTVKTLFRKLSYWVRARVRLNLGRRRWYVRYNHRWLGYLQSLYPNLVLKEMGLITLEDLLAG